jgi:tRNA threonylcarbamoyladenosine biosynthesis protein TsaE
VELGRRLAAEVAAPNVLLLEGQLGSGKTTFAKGLISGLGAAREEEVTSPSFTLVHQYGGSPENVPRVYHIDLYRIEPGRDLETLGLDDVFRQKAVVLIEWGEKLAGLYRGPGWTVQFEDLGGDRRRIVVEAENGQADSHQQNPD